MILTLQRFEFLAELRNNVLRCRCCDMNVAQVDGVDSIADLDKVTAVSIIDAIEEVPTLILLLKGSYTNYF